MIEVHQLCGFAGGAQPGEKGYPFGLNKRRTTKALREFAEEVGREESDVVLQTVSINREQKHDDYVLTTLTITFHERRIVPQEEPDPSASPVGTVSE